MKNGHLQKRIFSLHSKALALAGLLLFAQAAFADLPTVGFKFQNQNAEVSGHFFSLENSDDTAELISGFDSEVKKSRQENPQLQVLVHRFDGVDHQVDREIATDDRAESLAREIAKTTLGVEVDGQAVHLTDSQLRYIKNVDSFAFIMRVGAIGTVYSIHLYLTHRIPMWVAVGAGLATASAMLFNTVNTEKVANLILYGQWKTLTPSEVVTLNAKREALTLRGKAFRLGKVFFNSFLYEVACQGTVQGVIAGLFKMSGENLGLSAGRFFGSVFTGTVGETAFDFAQGAYQETRAALVPPEIRTANMKLIATFASVLGVSGVLLSSDAAVVGHWSLGTMVTAGISLIAYFRYTNEIHQIVAPVTSAAKERTMDFLNGVDGLFKYIRKTTCKFLLKSKND